MTVRKTASWDAAWAEILGGGTETIRGVQVRIPTDIPLAMEQRLSVLGESESEDDIREMVALLFGADVLDQWRENGMGLLEFKTVLAWGTAHASGSKVTVREAYDAVVAAEADEGKAPANRAARRAASKTPSAPTGGRSKRTSSANTGSGRPRSRA